MNIQDWFPLGWTGWISLQSKGLKSLQHYSSKASILQHSAFFIVQFSHPYMTAGKPLFNCMDLCWQSNVSAFNMLSGFVIYFLQTGKCLLISWLQSPSVEPPQIKSVTVFTVSPSICHEVMGPDAMIFIYWILSFKPAFFHSPLSLSSRGSLVLLHILP